jgi:toxin HigB-1
VQKHAPPAALRKFGMVNCVRNMPPEIQVIGRRKLRMLNNSQNLNDLKVPPSNKLEKLSGKVNNLYSIRINDQWRITFQWDDGLATEVTIIDYHK